ncbi:hypothetical protein AVEN_206875-1 [Araneus ventricosus]|uniref:Uncharacterized protein n=1 Tax=Araneus ventricosus TaxID=182803 RepID=A0A4Y2HEF0_ARAVE|nr:hypothetical protein AVEN_206875-1 [Araneus ventricosus]
MVIGEVEVIATEKKRKGKRKQMEDKSIKRKMVKTDADAAHAQSMELLELNTMSSSLYTDTDLPLRHLVNSLDGATIGPKEFCQPLGKAIKTYEELPVAPFSSISMENMPHNIDRMVLSNDQQYLYDICLPISRSECYSDLTLRKPGPVVHSRWLTIAGRILRLYVVTEKPSDNLIILATYIMKVYGTCMVGSMSRQSPP